MSLIKALVIAGPTTSGKSDLAVSVAEEFNGAVINGDSIQIYKGLETISAAPSNDLRARVPHKLYAIRDPAYPCSAGEWVELAKNEILATHNAGMLPIIVGGTGLYLKALMSGIAKIPSISNKIRNTLRRRILSEGNATLYAELFKTDPETAKKLNISDSQRILRALEVYQMTGKTLRQWHKERGDQVGGSEIEFNSVLLRPPRKQLYANCNARFERMVKTGAVEEVKALVKKELDPALPAMKALGVPEILLYLDGSLSLEEAIGAGQLATRHYVKRQETWFNNQFISELKIETQYNFNINPRIFPFISKFLLT